MSVRSRSNWNLEVLVFKLRIGENRSNLRTNTTPGFKPGPHWWEASALISAPPLLYLQKMKNGYESFKKLSYMKIMTCKRQVNNVYYNNWTEWSAIWSDLKIGRERSTSMISDQNYTTRSSSTIKLQPFWNRVAGLFKSGNKKAFTSHFVFETEMMGYRAKMERFKT